MMTNAVRWIATQLTTMIVLPAAATVLWRGAKLATRRIHAQATVMITIHALLILRLAARKIATFPVILGSSLPVQMMTDAVRQDATL
jgi:hypothetical protein